MTITIKGTIYSKIDEYTSERMYHFSTWDMGGGWAPVQEYTIEVEQQQTEEEMVLAEIGELNKGIKNVKQAAYEKVQEIEERIMKISALSYYRPAPTSAAEAASEGAAE